MLGECWFRQQGGAADKGCAAAHRRCKVFQIVQKLCQPRRQQRLGHRVHKGAGGRLAKHLDPSRSGIGGGSRQQGVGVGGSKSSDLFGVTTPPPAYFLAVHVRTNSIAQASSRLQAGADTARQKAVR